jgi:hypothetical protein
MPLKGVEIPKTLRVAFLSLGPLEKPECNTDRQPAARTYKRLFDRHRSEHYSRDRSLHAILERFL